MLFQRITRFVPAHLQRCNFSQSSVIRQSNNGFALTYEKFGDPVEVLKKVPIHAERSLKSNQLVLKYLASPINPADLNTIQGVYPVKPANFPAIAGNEGVAEVIKVGANVKNVNVGDKVIPARDTSGTWTTHTIFSEKEVIVLDKNIDTLFAAQIAVNPCTAYRMLKDFVDLQKGKQTSILSCKLMNCNHCR